jgi:hypothetical protein
MGVRLASGGIADSEGTRVELRVEVRKDASSARRASDSSPRRKPWECGGRGRTPEGAEDGAPRSPAPRASVNSAAFRRLSAAPFLGAASRSPSAHLPESLSPTRAPQPCDLRRQADFPLLIRPDFLERRIWTAYQIGGRKGCSQECGAGRRVAIPRGFRSAKTSSPTKRVL